MVYLCSMEKTKDIKALFFDVDGTLVSFNTHRIPRSTIEALEAAKEKGIKIFIATGRPLVYINNLGEIAHLIDGYVTTNGGCVVIGGEVIACHAIPMDDVRTMMRFADERGFSCILVGETDALLYNATREVEEFFHRLLDLDQVSSPITLDALLKQRITQMTPIIPAEVEAEINSKDHERLEGEFGERLREQIEELPEGMACFRLIFNVQLQLQCCSKDFN